ncbi:MAG: histidine kinase [Clostridia bacterium]
MFKYLKSLIILTIVSVIIFGFTLPSNTTNFKYVDKQNINNGWTQIIDGESFFIDSSKNIIPVEAGEKIIIEQTLTADNTNLDLLLYAKHQEVTILVDDEVIYSLETPENMDFFASPGKIWVNATIPKNSINKTIRFEFCSQFETYQNVPNYIYLLDASDIHSVQTNLTWLRNSSAFVIVILAFMAYINAFIWKDKKRKRFLFTLADFYTIIALWICSELNILTAILGRTSITSLLAMIFIRMIPVAFYHMGSATTEKNPRWFDVIGIISWCSLILSLVLQFIFKISFIAQLPLFTFFMLLSSGIFLISILYQYIADPLRRSQQVVLFSSAVLVISGIFEANCYINHYDHGQNSGLAVCAACITYAFIIHIYLANRESVTNLEKRELEKHFKLLQQKPLTQQINAHFLGNTLNTISAYCKSDPKKADKAVHYLSKYMREYMYLVNSSDYATFDEELYVVQLYLDIVNMRFNDSVTCNIINNFDDFLLPPLCLQPLVENALRHGIRQQLEAGYISITSSKVKDMAEIKIFDNGIGFNPDKMDSYMGISLTNIKSRIVQMGGSMVINSKPNHGTEITLLVPINIEDSEPIKEFL